MAKKTINREDVKKVAELARINLTIKELEKFRKDLESILEAFKKLDRVNTKNVKPSFQPNPIKNVFRKDEAKPGLTQEEALANTKQKEKGYFKGPKAA